MRTIPVCLLVVLSVVVAVGAQEPARTARALPPVLVVQVEGKAEPIRVAAVKAEVRILGPLAETRLTMTFENPHDRDLEGDLYFPLPEGSTVSGYALDIGGRMVDGVAVTKEKARRTFEQEVRKGIDPGIVEWTRGNSFKTRIFPLPAHGSRTVTVSYVSETVDTPGGAVYVLPLNFREKVREFALRVEVLKAGAAPQVAENDFADFAFARWQEGFVAETRMTDAALTRDLRIALPPAGENPVYVERDGKGVVRFLAVARTSAPATGAPPAPKRVTVLWDASGSRASSDRALEIEFLRRYLSRSPGGVAVRLVVFRNRAEEPRDFEVTAESFDALAVALERIPCDGGTTLSAIPPAGDGPPPDRILLFTDGLSTFGASEPGAFSAPVTVVHASGVADAPLLRALARGTGGRYLNLTTTDLAGAVESVDRPVHSFFSAVIDKGGVADFDAAVAEAYPRRAEPADGRFLYTGVLREAGAEVVLNFGVRHVTDSKTFTVSAADAVEGDLLRRYWAQRKLADLLPEQDENEFEITRLGREHGLVTPFTSLIVLETLEQYLEHRILPPKTLPVMRAEYADVVERERRETVVAEKRKLERIVTLWEERVKWWETKFTYPEGFRYQAEEGKNEDSAGSDGGGALGGDAAPRAPAPAAGAAPSGAPEAEAPGEGMGFGFAEGDEEGGDDGAAEERPEPGLVLREWDPQTPYLKALKAAPEAGRYDLYLNLREEYGGSPAYFLDCADFFLREGDERHGIRVLSNVAEMELENASLLRILGHRLEQLGHYDLSIHAFEQAKRLRPEEPQSWRDLGLVLAKRGTKADLERAIELLYHVVLNEWERFDQIELLTLMELNQVIPRARAAGVTEIPVDPRLVKPLDLDVRIVMTWDADLTDMDLHVIEPSGEEAFYGHNRTTIGGLVSRDFTQGYGPEEYLLRRAMTGRYLVKAQFYGSSAAKLIGAVTLHVEVFTNYGKPNQKSRSMTLRLTGSGDTFEVGEIEF